MKNQRVKDIISVLVILLVDLLSLYLAIFLASIVRNYLPNIFDISPFDFVFRYSSYYFYISSIFVFIFIYEKLYTIRLSFWDETKKVVKAVTLGIIFTLALITLYRGDEDVSRLTILLVYIFAIFIFPFFRYRAKKFLYQIDIYSKNLLIVSNDSLEVNIIKEALEKESNLGYKIINTVLFDTKISQKQIEYISKLNEAGVVIVCQDREIKEKSINILQEYVDRIFFLPSYKNVALLNSKIEYLFNSQLFIVKLENNLNKFHNKVLKKIFDKFLAILLLPILLPLLAIIALTIRVSTKESAFFIQRRLGEVNKDFNCIKFQTMYPNGDELLESFFKKSPKDKEHWDKYKKIHITVNAY